MSAPSDPLSVLEIVVHQEFLRSLARGLVSDATSVDDLVQETYLHVMNRPPERPRRLRAWLARLLVNLARDRRRSDARRAARERGFMAAAAAAPAPNADALVQRMELHQRLVQFVLALEPRYRDIVLHHHFEGQTLAQVADRLAIPLETARTRLRRAMHELRQRVDAELGGRHAAIAALLPLARMTVQTLHAMSPAAITAGSALIGVPLVMSATSKVVVAALAVLMLSGVATWVMLDHDPVAQRPVVVESAGAQPSPSLPMADQVTAVTKPVERVAVDANPSAPLTPVAPGLGILHVTAVWDDDDSPAAGVHVRLARQGESQTLAPVRRARTDEQGELLLLDVSPGPCEIGAAGFDAEHAVVVRAGETSEITLRLPNELAVSGDVVDGAGRPIAGAEIWIGDRKTALSDGTFVTTTDADGRFTIRSVGNFHFASASAPGLAMADAIAVTGSQRSPSAKQIHFVLDALAAKVRGRVRDDRGQPLAEVLVLADSNTGNSRLLADGSIADRPPLRLVRTDREGRFEIERVRPGDVALLVRADQFAPTVAIARVAAGDTLERDFDLTAGGSIEGVVRDAVGDPVDQVRIEAFTGFESRLSTLLSAHCRSRADGRFVIEHLAPRLVVLDAQGGERGAVRKPVPVSEGSVAQCDLVLARPLTLRGKVIDERAQPVADCGVELEPREPSPLPIPGLVRTDAAGCFAIMNCAAIAYTVKLLDPALPFLVADEQGPVRVDDHEITLVLADAKRPSARIVGRLRDPDSQPAGGALVQIFRERGNAITGIHCSATGEFTFGPLPPGRYVVWAGLSGCPDLALGTHHLAASATLDLGEVRFARPGSLTVRADRSDGVLVTPLDLRLQRRGGGREDLAQADRELRATNLEPGDYMVTVVGDGLAAQQLPVRVNAGQNAVLELHVEPGVACALRLRRHDGAKLTGPITWTVRSGNGAVVAGTQEVASEATSVDQQLSLAVGEWQLDARAPDGAHGGLLFSVSRRQNADPIEVVLGR